MQVFFLLFRSYSPIRDLGGCIRPCFLRKKEHGLFGQSMDISIFVDMSAVWYISTPWDHLFWDISTHWDLSFWHISTHWDLSFYWHKSWTWEISTCWNVLEWEISMGWNIPEWLISRGWDMPNCWYIYKYQNFYWLLKHKSKKKDLTLNMILLLYKEYLLTIMMH